MLRSWSGSAQLLVAAALSFASGSCFVESRCQTHEDCTGHESCDRLSGTCRIECTRDEDCWLPGRPIGMECRSFRCEFPFGERVLAPNFCLDDANPQSPFYGKTLCLHDLTGKVVLIYFGLLA